MLAQIDSSPLKEQLNKVKTTLTEFLTRLRHITAEAAVRIDGGNCSLRQYNCGALRQFS